MEREAEYRRRLSDVATSVKRRLDYQVQMENLQRQFEQRQLVSWIEEQVLQTVQSKPVRAIFCIPHVAHVHYDCVVFYATHM